MPRQTPLRAGFAVAPGAWPVLGHIPVAHRSMPAFVRRTRQLLGPAFWILLGRKTFVLLCTGPEAIGVLKSPQYSSGHLESVSPIVAGQSLLAHDGDRHRRMRSAMNRPLSPRGISASAAGAMSAACFEGHVERWLARGSARVLPDVQETALEIMFRVLGVASAELPDWRTRYRDLILANLGIDLHFPGSPAWRAARAKRWIDDRFRIMVRAAQGAPPAPGLLAAIARAEDDDGHRLDDVELIDNLRLLVLGGHETISSTIAWITIALASHDGAWDKLVAEVGDLGVPTTIDEARAFPYAEALFRETVRIHPPFGAITRRAEKGATFDGRPVAEGTVVAADLWSASHDPAAYEDADSFVPSRWLGRSSSPSPAEAVQFGAGPHFCLGYHLAWLEAVQFAVAFARGMVRRGRRPRLVGPPPSPVYLPTERPPSGTRIELVAQ